mmetsp:Transcript_91011/g.241719  ORF Transcript_91011/g.241719 Transcript_91011/m.241719 type:complete len:151 (-) Transcript_91011:148-600(-)
MATADQVKQAKQVIRDFVVEMRDGRKIMVMTPTGNLKTTTCSLSKKLDVFRIARSGKVRRVPLKDCTGIHAGTEPEGISTPLDDLCATVVVGPDGSLISFRFEHINARDTFVMCMTLFANSAGARLGGDGEASEEEDEEDFDDEGSGSAT